MVDTISIRLLRPVPLRHLPAGWRIITNERRDETGPDATQPRCGLNVIHKKSGMRIWGKDMILLRAEFSLPRMMATNNNNLLETPEQMEEAIKRASDIAALVLAEPLVGRIKRLDLCSQHRGPASLWVAAFRNATHPKIRKKNRDINGETLYIKGSELGFCIYDKGLEAKTMRDKVVRLECKLMNARMISGCFGKELYLSGLNFDECYRVYRELVLGLTPEHLVIAGQTLKVADVLLYFDLKGHHDHVDHLLRAMSRSTRSRTKARMQTSQQRQSGIDLPALLPEHGPVDFARISETHVVQAESTSVAPPSIRAA
jgi:hypothetical protein